VGLAVFAAVTLGWLLPFLVAGPQSFGENVLRQDWLATYLGLPLPRRVGSFVLDALAGFLPWTLVLVVALAWALRERANPAVRFALLTFAVPFLMIIFSRSRLPRYLLPIYPGAALLVAWWADAHGETRTPLARLVGWLSFAGVLGALIVLPRISAVREASLTMEAGMVWKTLPLFAAGILIAAVFLTSLAWARPALLVGGGAVLMAFVLGYGAWLFHDMTDRREDFRALAETLRRQAPNGDLRVFTQAKLLPLDFYFGHELPRLLTVAALREYVVVSQRPTVLIDRQNLRITPPELLQELRVLERLGIHEQRLFLLGCGAAERSTGSARCAGAASTLEPVRR
jgi:4-amino-4-deoxy-L-arabinose transferase-like glycosyltransferase